ncbi:MAG TPA: hypothetical protein VGC62_00865, partial [Pseudomonas sp.]|uniref:hypothetical protein n=1 Tax=Pseudomonas sp. TaxID=306 RepID=UPI002EDA5D62
MTVPAIDLPNGSHIHYEISGHGPGILALAPGGLHSRSELWTRREDGRPRGIISPVEAFGEHCT